MNTPPVEYHRIMFYISNQFDTGFCGVAKTLPAVVDAFHQLEKKQFKQPGNNNIIPVDVKLLDVGDDDNPRVIPLIKYKCYSYHPYPVPVATVHPNQTKWGADVKSMMDLKLRLYNYDGADGIGDEWKLLFEDKSGGDALLSFEGTLNGVQLNVDGIFMGEIRTEKARLRHGFVEMERAGMNVLSMTEMIATEINLLPK